MKPVEVPPGRVHLLVVLPRLGDHHQHGVRQRPAAQVQQLQAFVEAGRVADRIIEDRQQPLDAAARGVGAEHVGGQLRLPGAHPVPVAADGVDLAVVGDQPVRMRQRPGREGVGGEPRVHQRDGRPVPRIGQVREERLELQRGEHALVDDRRAGQAGQVQAGLVLGSLAQAVRLPVQRQPGLPGQPGHDQLDKLGQHLGGPVPAKIGVVRHVAPAEHRQPFVRGKPPDCAPAPAVRLSPAGRKARPAA